MSSYFSLFTFRFSLFLSATIFVAGCSLPANPVTGSGSVRDLLHTASGYVLEVSKQAAAIIELGKRGMERGQETVEDAQRRAALLKEGMESVKKGKELIEQGLAQ